MGVKKKGVTSYDWRDKIHLNPVRDQSKGNCCYAFVVCFLIEILHQIDQKNKKQRGGRFVLSPQDIYNHMINDKKQDAEGCSFLETLQWVRDHGCILDSDCVYKGRFMAVKYSREPYMRITTFYEIKLQDNIFSRIELEKLETRVREQIMIAPVAAHILWIDEMEKIKDGIYSGPKDEASFAETHKHGVVIVGFGKSTKNNEVVKYWLIRNTRGKKWGSKGYGKIGLAPTHGRLLVQSVWVVSGVEKM